MHLYFGDTIKKDCTIEIFNYTKRVDNYELTDDKIYIDIQNCYLPDFCFIHQTTGLKIDIEIDEPYTYQRPIHYFGSDNKRNKYFTDKNWFVLRFSEQQILKAPNECCREIAEVIYDFTNDIQYLTKLLTIARLPRVEKWKLDNTKYLISQQQRHSYPDLEQRSISTDFIVGVWECENYSYEFNNTSVKMVIKRKGFVEKAWKRKEGIFYILKDKTNRHIIHVLWSDSLLDYLIIDYATKDKLTITNKYTRDIQILKLTTSFNAIQIKNCYDQTSDNSYTIAEIKEIFLQGTLQLYTDNRETELAYNTDKKNSIMLFMHRSLLEKIKINKAYKLSLGVPIFVMSKNEGNYIKIEITDYQKLKAA